LALLRYFPHLEKDKLATPEVNELTLSLTDNLQIVDLWTGAAEISFPDVPNEELSALKPVKSEPASGTASPIRSPTCES
jgi:hypothetical protein